MQNDFVQTKEVNIDLVLRQIETVSIEISELKPMEAPQITLEERSIEAELDYESSFGDMRLLFDREMLPQILEDEVSLQIVQGWKTYRKMESLFEEEKTLKRTK